MLFRFLKYLQPTHYFTLVRKDGRLPFPDPDKLPEPVRNRLVPDTGYVSDLATRYDLAWQALNKGYIGNVPSLAEVSELPLKDEYRFARRYFSRAWVFYCLLFRVLELNNPFKELRAWMGTRQVGKSNYMKEPIRYDTWKGFESSLLRDTPKISVIIPTLNRYRYLEDVLTDLGNQDYPNFDVIVIDQSEPFDEEFYKGSDLDLTVRYQEEKALWLARNTAVRMSDADLLLFFDDDSRVDPDWISNHVKCLDFFKADLSSGVSISKVGGRVPDHYSFFRISDQLDTGNVLIKRHVFETIGLFDRQFEKQRMGDGEFGLRAYLQGFLNVSNPYARRLHLKVDSGGLRQMGSWDAFRTNKVFAPRPIPSVLYFFRRYFGSGQAKYALWRSVPLSIIPYRFKKNKPLLILGVFISVLLLPLVLFQVGRSWRLSGKKLNEGPLITELV